MPPSRLLWLIECDPNEPRGDRLIVATPPDTTFAPVPLDGGWQGPAGHEPAGVLLVVPEARTGTAAATVQVIRARSALPIAVAFERSTITAQQSVLGAGATASLALGGTSSGAVERLRRKLESMTSLFVESLDGRPQPDRADVRIVAVGSSTGGPDALLATFAGIGPFDAPVVIAQHVHEGYDEPLARWLTEHGLPCRVATEGALLAGGSALLAPAGTDMAVSCGRIQLSEAHGRYVPSADRLFESVSREFGRHAIGVLLTGMGDDGARGLLKLRHAGGFTITQRADTCVVDGMPASARALAAQCVDWTPDEIRNYFAQLRDPALTG